MIRRLLKLGGLLVVVGLVYGVVTFVQVYGASRRDGAREADAIIVFGAAQYNGKPSPVLKARLDHAADLWEQKLAPVIVVTGGRQPGDQFTEATASATYLIQTRHVPDSALLREVSGTTSWESLASAAAFLKRQGRTEVLLVSDPFHAARTTAMASELGLDAHASPTRTSPIKGARALGYIGRETVAVGIGRVVGFSRVAGIDERVDRVRTDLVTG